MTKRQAHRRKRFCKAVAFLLAFALSLVAWNYGVDHRDLESKASATPAAEVVAPLPACMDPQYVPVVAVDGSWTCTLNLLIVLRQRIGGCETVHNPLGKIAYKQPNLFGSSASGGFQILDSTWVQWIRRFRPDLLGVYRRALDAPPVLQDEIAMDALTTKGIETQPWNASRRCWS